MILNPEFTQYRDRTNGPSNDASSALSTDHVPDEEMIDDILANRERDYVTASVQTMVLASLRQGLKQPSGDCAS